MLRPSVLGIGGTAITYPPNPTHCISLVVHDFFSKNDAGPEKFPAIVELALMARPILTSFSSKLIEYFWSFVIYNIRFGICSCPHADVTATAVVTTIGKVAF